MDIGAELISGAGLILAIVVIVAVWGFARSVWYWIAAKVMGWDENEKFLRETRWVEREALREERQQEKDAVAGGFDRRREGAGWVTLAVALLLWRMNMPWWEMAIVVGLTYIGLNMVAGVAIKWWG